MRLMIAWRNLFTRPVQNLLTVFVVAATIAMMVIITLLSTGIHNGLVKATEPFDLIVGAKGSPNQLVLNTVFLQDAPIGNIDHAVLEKLNANPLVAAAIPLAFGDNYRGYAIVGADSSIFQHQPKADQQEWPQLAAGRPFSRPWEAAIGAKAARDLGLKPGDEFKSVHGMLAGSQEHEHAQPYQVVGVLQPVNGPYDQAILVSIDSIWQAHEQHEHHQAETTGHESLAAVDAANHEEEHAVTAILVKPKGYSEAMRLYQQFLREPAAQLVFPAQIIVRLFAMLGQGEQVLTTAATVITALGLVIMSLSVYWSALSRTRERAILRALGAGARDIFIIILAEGALLTMIGVLAGSLTGHAVYTLLAGTMQSKTAIALTTGFTLAEGYIIIGGSALGVLAGLVPAFSAYRREIAQDL